MAQLILLVDDDESLRRVTEYNLNAAGFQVVSSIVDGAKRIGEDNKRKSKETKLGCLAVFAVIVLLLLIMVANS